MTQEEIFSQLAAKFPKVQKMEPGVKGYLTARLPVPADIVPVAQWLKDAGFRYLDMVTAVDYVGPVEMKGFISDPNPNHFLPEGATPQAEAPVRTPGYNYRETLEVVYLLSNLEQRVKIFLKVELPRGDARIPSLISLFKAADWQEREAFDLLGVRFDGHPNLAKILTPDFIQGHPLRKDYIHVKDRFD